MLATLVALYTLYLIVSLYTSVMQIGFINQAKRKSALLLSPSEYLKAGNYAVEKEKLSIVNSFVDYLLFIAWIGFGIAYLEKSFFMENEAMMSVAIVMGFVLINAFISLPFSYYEKFVLDQKYGFNKSSVKLFIKDTLITFIMTLVLGSLVVWAIYAIMTALELWWLWSFAFLFGVVLLINMFFPTVRALFFDKVTPLENEELKEEIQTLMEKTGFVSSGVFVSDASKRDARLNAYFGGLGKSKRVILFDTLIEKLTTRELLAVLGHELGHFAHGDIYKNIAMVGVMLFGMFALFGNLPESLYMELGLSESPHIVMILLLLFMPVLGFIMMPIMGIVSRHNEYEADKMGSELAGAAGEIELANALQKLVTENKSFPLSHPVYIFFHYTHPPVLERLKALGVDLHDTDKSSLEAPCQAQL
ncbi:MAG: M48 family metallopeptidase [Sulfurimonas sp.]|jgi:STE24 endopeptidase|nr:M48 family metallopeptidase [Sulfurimonas sp.]